MTKYNEGMALVEKIVRNGGNEFDNYLEQSWLRKNEILIEVFRRIIIYIWMNNLAKPYWSDADKKAMETAKELGIPDNSFVFKSKNSADQVVAVISLVVNDLKGSFELSYRLKAKDAETEEKYKKIIQKDIADVERILAKNLPENLFIKTFFDVLNAKRLCYVSGSEALIMKRILEKASKYFPDFKEISYKKKIHILRAAYRNAMKESKNLRDKYTFARATLEEFISNNLVTRVYNYYFITGKFKLFRKIGYSANVMKTQKGYMPWFIEFEYDAGDTVLRTCFGTYDLWDLLAKGEAAGI